jgi:protein-L-isoaspartate(D-aspartate) O-methyltransferase
VALRWRNGLAAALMALGVNDAAAQSDPARLRARMVEEVEAMYAETRAETGVPSMSAAVRAAMGKVERHRLVGAEQAGLAYRNHPLPIGSGQTISQPYIVAISADLVRPEPGHVVLEIGTGSGYQAAVLAEIVRQVFTIELIEPLGLRAAERLRALGYTNIEVRIGDGYQGWPEKAPFDGIVVTAAAPYVPKALVEQLRPGGRMVIPLGGPGDIQFLTVIEKHADGSVSERRALPVRFVPLVPGAR